MPSKHDIACRHRIPQVRYRVTNPLGALLRSWPAYEAGLRRHGDLTLWLDEAAPDGWAAPKRSSHGGQPLYSEVAIKLVLDASHRIPSGLARIGGVQPRRAASAQASAVVPDHSTLS